MPATPSSRYQYTWKMIAAMAVGFGAFAFVLLGLSTDWVFAAGMAVAVVLVTGAFGAYMRRINPPPPAN